MIATDRQPDDAICTEHHTDVSVCIPDDLYAAWTDHEATVEDSDFTLGDLFRDALVNFLWSVDRLPKPYV